MTLGDAGSGATAAAGPGRTSTPSHGNSLGEGRFHRHAGWVTIFVLAFVLRAGWGILPSSRGHDLSALEFPDEMQYWQIAGSLAAGEGLQDEFGFRATRMPLYPGLLSVFAWAWGGSPGVLAAKGAQWVVGAISAALTAALGAAMFGRRIGLVAGTLAACDPFLVFFSSLLLTETLFVAALLGLWWAVWSAATRPRFAWPSWILAGIVAALCVYTRESCAGLVVAVLVFAALGLRVESHGRFGALGPVVAGAIAFSALFPWALRNRWVVGEWYWLTTRGGISLYDGVGPQAMGASHLEGIQDAPDVRGLSEVAWDRHFWRESWRAIRENPGRIVRLAGKKLARTWNPFPNVGTYQSSAVRTVSAAWMLPLYAFALAGAVLLTINDTSCGGRRRTGGWQAAYLLLPAVYFSVIHSLFVGSVRYRLAAMPMLEILAAVAVLAAINRGVRRRARIPGAPSG